MRLRRRRVQTCSRKLTYSGIEMDVLTTAFAATAIRSRSADEYRILRNFLETPQRCFPPASPRGRLAHSEDIGSAVDVHVRRLRIALGTRGKHLIRTVRSGYSLDADGTPDISDDEITGYVVPMPQGAACLP